MPIFYVHQKQTYVTEHDGGFVWSPQKTSSGQDHVGFSNMTKIHRGDYILHHCKGKILSIGLATTGCYEAEKPHKLGGNWDNNGFRVDVKYFDLDVPFDVLAYKQQLKGLPNNGKGNAFTSEGLPSQFYMCVLTNEQAIFLLNSMLPLQSDDDLNRQIKQALLVVREDIDYDDYSEAVDSVIESGVIPEAPSWSGHPKPIEMSQSSTTLRDVPKRDVKVAINALCLADHKCECDPSHQTFTRKNTPIPYMESHHLIPISRFREFKYSLDVEENIVSLCPNCHRLLHHGKMSEKERLLRRLFESRLSGLQKCGIALSFEKLKEYYS